jgi:hypothetical protein
MGVVSDRVIRHRRRPRVDDAGSWSAAIGVRVRKPVGTPLPGPVVGRRQWRFRQAVVQAVPLRVNAAGMAALPVWLAWKPIAAEPPAGMAPL